VSDPTNPKDAVWIGDSNALAADTIATTIDDETNTVYVRFGQSVGNAVVEVVTLVVQRDVVESIGGALLNLGNKPRPGE